jgi:DNA polymerase elongation subunit (family B)
MDPILFGYNNEERIVAVHQRGEHAMRVYTRMADSVSHQDIDFFPFFFLSTPEYLNGFALKHWIKELSGNNYYKYICAFTRWADMWDAIHFMIEQYAVRTQTKVESYADLPFLHLRPDAVSQFLMQTGRTLFKGMEFEHLHRLQLDIETYTAHGHRFSNANRPEDRIIVISLSDNRGWEHAISGQSSSEKEMLLELKTIINDHDYDVIEGHNIYNFDLPYILKRCELTGVEFAIGRDGSTLRSFETRTAFAERSVDYMSFEIAGRHIIDTWLLLQSYDVSKRSLDSYGLKSAARHFGFARENRIYITPEKISWYWDNEPDLLIRYALDDVYETKMLSEFLSPTYFYMSQMVPYNFGTIARMGSAAKIESLILREYVREKYSVPTPEPGLQTTGGYTDIFITGMVEHVLDVDVESLYPSIMIERAIAPERETAGVFLSLLKNLTAMRLDAKRKMKSAKDPHLRSKLDALQSAFKILINSFYGYLGYNRALFTDVKKADAVTTTGQEILRRLISAITDRQGDVIQVDTDGIFFSAPGTIRTEEEEQRFVAAVAKELPQGINLAINGRYKAMLSYKKKNYALLDYSNKIKIKGSSLTSRSMEKFGKNFVHQCLDALLNNNIDAIHTLYVNLYNDISEHRLSVSDFARSETLKESILEYNNAVRAGKRNKMASYEAALNSGLHWKQGDRISYYITGSDANVRGFEHCKHADEWDPNTPDENVAFYLKRLRELAKKFEVFFTPQDFRSIFSADDLFPFSGRGIQVVTTQNSLQEQRRKEVRPGEELGIQLEEADSEEDDQ